MLYTYVKRFTCTFHGVQQLCDGQNGDSMVTRAHGCFLLHPCVKFKNFTSARVTVFQKGLYIAVLAHVLRPEFLQNSFL